MIGDDTKYEYWRTAFPKLQSVGFEKTSSKTSEYNCIAHAVGTNDRWWSDAESEDEGYYWPIDRVESRIGQVEELEAALAHEGFVKCDSTRVEPGYEKVAIYVKDDNRWEHAARQLNDGRWSTKDGVNADFSHATLECVCPHYGRVYCYMKRVVAAAAVSPAPTVLISAP